MNVTSLASFFERFKYRIASYARLLDIHMHVSSFATPGSEEKIQRIYVINLDRKPARWNQVNRELSRFKCGSGSLLSSIARRFSAIDARYMVGDPDENSLQPFYSLADQLLVEPNPQLHIDAKSRMRRIEMSRQEIAVALSHIEVWKLIASGDVQYTLILEDDVFFRHGFSKSLDAAWLSLMRKSTANSAFDLFYLSYKSVGTNKSDIRLSESIKVPSCGLWYASGYVLSKSGARKLLALLPVHGPIDLWLNLQFDKLEVYMTHHSLIEQRIDVLSTNSYSIMPVLSQVGVYTHEKPLVTRLRELPSPVFAFGEPRSGLTAIATALSMLGYTCCSDICSLPVQELNALLSNGGDHRFNAYVNIGSFGDQTLTTIAELYPNARFIITNPYREEHLSLPPGRVLHLPIEHRDKWSALSTFLKLEYPAFPFPVCRDHGQQEIAYRHNEDRVSLPCKNLKFDSSPWIVSSNKWNGITISEVGQHDSSKAVVTQVLCGGTELDEKYWRLRDDTFPSNLALFSPDNLKFDLRTTSLVIRKETTPVRSFTSAAIASQQKHLYGKFAVELRPPNVSGLITGVFLHRNEPRQEIDIEFLGKDTTKMLVNVYYNPGVDGTKLEYGYRGTPTMIELGFDAAAEFHYYEIEWHENIIRWRVDGAVVHERVLWNPTPIPNLPMEFNVNLWHSRSKELAGKMETERLPAQVAIRAIRISKNNCFPSGLDTSSDRKGRQK